METKRAFISVDLSDAVKNKIKRLQKQQIRWIKWMNVSNMHITLNFLGDLERDEIETVKIILAELVTKYAKFDLTLSEFKAKRNMLWLLPERSETLEDLRYELNKELKASRIGKREKRKYSPHILVGKSKNQNRKMTWEPENYEPAKFEVSAINLYESRLTPGSATHTLIESFGLNDE